MSIASHPGLRPSYPTLVRRSRLLTVLGKTGYAARAVVFGVLGVLVVLTGVGLKRNDNDPIGALEAIASAPHGGVLTAAVAIGLFAYAVWNVVIGVATAISAWRRGRKKRVVIGVGYVLTGAFYAPLAWASAKLAFGARAADGARHFGRMFAEPNGRTVVGVIGIALLVAAIVQLVIGIGRTFTEVLDVDRLSRRERRMLVALGSFGFVARGAFFGLVGGCVVRAWMKAAPSEAHGPDRAIDVVLSVPHGIAFLLPLGIGLVAFGVFSALASRRLQA